MFYFYRNLFEHCDVTRVLELRHIKHMKTPHRGFIPYHFSSKSDKGFTTIGAVLAIISILIIIFVGVYFWTHRGTTPANTFNYTPPPSTGSVQGEDTGPGELLIVLAEQNKSNEKGAASIIDANGKAKVIIDLGIAPAGPQPAHIHIGACPNPGEVLYPLTNVVNGKSETILPISITELLTKLPLAINVHKSTIEAGVYVSCGNIEKPLSKG